MSRSLRTLSVLARPSNFSPHLTRSTHSLLRHNGEINVQQVRFKKDYPRRSKRFLYGLAISWMVVYYTLGYVAADEEEVYNEAGRLAKKQSEVRQAENRDKAEDKPQEDEVEEDDVQVPEARPENSFFIPLGRVRQLPLTYYKGSDPEWKSFVEFRQDHKRSAAIQNELVDHIYSFFTGATNVQSMIGVPVRMGRIWLDIILPPSPPPEYERSGLEITPDYIAWTSRPISGLQVARLNSALKPLPVAKSFWASCSTYCSLQTAKLKQFLNIDPPSSETSPQLPVGAITVDQPRENTPPEKPPNHAQMNKMSDPKADAGSTKAPPAKSAPSDGSKIIGSLPPLPQPHSDIGTAITEFKRSIAENWHLPSTLSERGTFIVTGDVELVGPKGSCVLGVVADYHPREAKYLVVRVDFKHIIPRRQRLMPHPEPKKGNP